MWETKFHTHEIQNINSADVINIKYSILKNSGGKDSNHIPGNGKGVVVWNCYQPVRQLPYTI
jgi:hypothetical protein